MAFAYMLAAVLLETSHGGVSLKIESETSAIDPAKSVFLRVEVESPQGVSAAPPDLRDRVDGFSVAEDFSEEPAKATSGVTRQAVNWRLVPEPCADVYRIRPFAVQVDGGRGSFVAGPVYFDPPAEREPVTGEMEVSPKKDLPPLSWRLAGRVALWAVLAALAVFAAYMAVRYAVRRVREHRMSPIERAWVELDRLLKKGLPGRGRYKDFYVELTMVVRRYVQRKYGIRAPHLTTEEFLSEIASGGLDAKAGSSGLRRFLESADLVKFAGVEATPEMADGATDSARAYLKSDSAAKEGQ